MSAMKGKQEVEAALKSYEDVDSWKTVIFLYNAALKEVGTKLEILNDEFQHVHQYNPIEHIKTRIKTPESIVKKLKRYGYETSIENMVRYINDIAGVRLICSFTSDIYRLAEMIGNQSDLKVLSIKDYIKNPKESGYKSYHMLVSVPIFLSDSVVDTKVEIQIRTIAMDFWASLEHKIYYKFEGNAPEYISRDLRECAKMVSELDEKMLSLNEAIQECIAHQQNRDNMDDVLDHVIGNRKEQPRLHIHHFRVGSYENLLPKDWLSGNRLYVLPGVLLQSFPSENKDMITELPPVSPRPRLRADEFQKNLLSSVRYRRAKPGLLPFPKPSHIRHTDQILQPDHARNDDHNLSVKPLPEKLRPVF